MEDNEGYDLDVIGLDDGMFYPIHIMALISIALSFGCAVIVVAASFKLQNAKSFYSWPKNERFVVYIAIFEGSFNIIHTFDHIQMVMTKDHVYPLELCETYAFLIISLCFVKSSLLIATAVDAYILIRFHEALDFGKRDWKLMSVAVIPSVVTCIVLSALGQLGPTGAFCTIKESLAGLIVSVVSFICILSVNAFFYSSTWYYIRKNARVIQSVIGNQAQTSRAHLQAAKTMTLFVALFCTQWWAMLVFGIWNIVAKAPSGIYLSVVIFTNIGGVLNFVVFIMILKSKRKGKVGIANIQGKTNAVKTAQVKRTGNLSRYTDTETAALKNTASTGTDTSAMKNTADTDTATLKNETSTTTEQNC